MPVTGGIFNLCPLFILVTETMSFAQIIVSIETPNFSAIEETVSPFLTT
jgi:hypothetical protein